jgi:hypothetical protein
LTELEFVNDWSELEAAVAALKENADDHGSYYQDPWLQSSEAEHVFWVITEFVPRLLTQYASLLELSYVLTDLVEKQNALTPPSGLYLPDHR